MFRRTRAGIFFVNKAPDVEAVAGEKKIPVCMRRSQIFVVRLSYFYTFFANGKQGIAIL
jgi:hypothetical protein